MNKIGILGTGMVGTTLGTKLIQLGYEVKMGSRDAANKYAVEWVNQNGGKASAGGFNEAAKFGDIIFLCVKGDATLSVIKTLQPENVKGKTIIDITNPILFSNEKSTPVLIPELANTNSQGEEIQKLLKDANVVKTLNMVYCKVMTDPKRAGSDATMFISGNNKTAKTQVNEILNQFGWKDIIDLGNIATARSMEMLVILWLNTMNAINNMDFAFKIVKQEK